MASIPKRILKAFVRIDGSGRVVAGSLVLRQKMPKNGKWVEIPAHQCCDPLEVVPSQTELTTTSTTTEEPTTTSTTTTP